MKWGMLRNVKRLGVFLLLMYTPNSPGLTRYVSPAGGAVPPYTNWAGAARTIQDAVDAAWAGDLVIVDDGVYDVGGRVTPGGSLFNRVMITNDLTLRSRNGAGSTLIVGRPGAAGDPVRCVYISGYALLVGFTLTGGVTRTDGAWMVDTAGGGAFFDRDSRGGLHGCVVSGNRSAWHGGGVLTIDSFADLVDSTICDNVSGWGGGGVFSWAGQTTLANLRVVRNRSVGGGGGLGFYHSDGSVRNSLVAGNTAGAEGGGLYFDGSSPRVENLTIADNTAAAGVGGGVCVSYASHPQLMNCILWGNRSEQIAFNPDWYDMQITLGYSTIEGGAAGILTYGLGPVHWRQGNLVGDPLLVDEHDYTLKAASPCINAGLNLAWMPDAKDLAGRPRLLDERVDQGAHEAGEAPAVADWITKLGFSTRPDGDQDVTLFYRDETLWITVEDIGPNPGQFLRFVTATLVQKNGRSYITRTIRLSPSGLDRFVGSLPLAAFRPGDVMVAISGAGAGRALHRQAAILVR